MNKRAPVPLLIEDNCSFRSNCPSYIYSLSLSSPLVVPRSANPRIPLQLLQTNPMHPSAFNGGKGKKKENSKKMLQRASFSAQLLFGPQASLLAKLENKKEREKWKRRCACMHLLASCDGDAHAHSQINQCTRKRDQIPHPSCFFSCILRRHARLFVVLSYIFSSSSSRMVLALMTAH